MSAHLSLTTDSRRYMNYLICLIVPSIIIWLILIPSIMYKMSKPEKSRLSYRSVQAYFNIMNVDYKRGYCYWDLQQLLLNSVMIVLFNVSYEAHVMLGLFAIILLAGNAIFKFVKQPMIDKRYALLDIIIDLVLIFNILLALFNKSYS